jgi:hypothetical protein
VFESSAETDFKVQLTDDAGRTIERTAYGRSLLTRERGGRNINRDLKAGESMSQELDLRRLFELASGTYKVALSRDAIIGESRVPLEATGTFTVP